MSYYKKCLEWQVVSTKEVTVMMAVVTTERGWGVAGFGTSHVIDAGGLELP